MDGATCSRMCQSQATPPDHPIRNTAYQRACPASTYGALLGPTVLYRSLLGVLRLVLLRHCLTSSINVRCGAHEDRMLTTGLHTVCDVSCAECEVSLGWKYVRAHESAQKYKEGKYILEKQFLDKQTVR